MDGAIKFSVVMELLNKQIAKTNSLLYKNTDDEKLSASLEYLLNFKKEILSGDFNGVDEFLEKYKENNL